MIENATIFQMIANLPLFVHTTLAWPLHCINYRKVIYGSDAHGDDWGFDPSTLPADTSPIMTSLLRKNDVILT